MYPNYNNPYIPQTQPRYQPMQQPVQQMQPVAPIQTGLQGKAVDSIDVVKAMDIPFDGSTSYFPLVDGTAIVTKSLQMDGTSKIVIYKPAEDVKKEIPKYLTIEDLKKELESITINDLEDLREDIDFIKEELKKIKKKDKGKEE